jgi:hypothetical protein
MGREPWPGVPAVRSFSQKGPFSAVSTPKYEGRPEASARFSPPSVIRNSASFSRSRQPSGLRALSVPAKSASSSAVARNSTSRSRLTPSRFSRTTDSSCRMPSVFMSSEPRP